jgi:hypothetical protein
MRNFNKAEPLISIHIPKCGGSSLKSVLRNWFGENLFFHYFNEKENKPPAKHNLKPNICIHGHFNKKRNFGIQDYYPSVTQFITFLRDPFDMIVSRYFYVKRKEKDGYYRNGEKIILQQDLNFYIETEITNKNYHPNITDYMPFEITDNNYREIIDKYFVYVGLVEDFQTSLSILSDKLGFSQNKVEHLNISTRNQTVSNYTKQRFIDSHQLEYAIYNYVFKIYKI